MLIATNERETDGVTILDGIILTSNINGGVPLRRRVNDCLVEGKRRLILNLTNCPRLGSQEIGDLAATIAVVRSAGGKLKLIVGKEIYDSFRLSKFLTIVDPHGQARGTLRDQASLDLNPGLVASGRSS